MKRRVFSTFPILAAAFFLLLASTDHSDITISGDEAAIKEVSEQVDRKSILDKRLRVDTAYHSHHMRKIVDEHLHSLNEESETRLYHRIRRDVGF